MFGFVLAVVLGVGVGWSGRELLGRPDEVLPAPSFTVVTVAEDSVSRSFSLGASAGWSGGASVVGGLAGTVTRVGFSGARSVRAGDVLYEVNLGPVVVGQGVVPAFRDLQIGARGGDVSQVQNLLRETGFRTVKASGSYDVATANQVYAWKKSLGLSPNGVVELGRVLFVRKLPARMALDPAVRVGAAAPVAARAVKVLPGQPTFTITLPVGQAGLARAGQDVTLTMDQARWPARIAALSVPDQDGSVTATLGPAAGGESICGAECERVPVAGASGIPAVIVVVPKVSGPTIPTAALRVAADGATAVIDESGRVIGVTVRASSGGLAVVEGVTPGTRVRVPPEGR